MNLRDGMGWYSRVQAFYQMALLSGEVWAFQFHLIIQARQKPPKRDDSVITRPYAMNDFMDDNQDLTLHPSRSLQVTRAPHKAMVLHGIPYNYTCRCILAQFYVLSDFQRHLFVKYINSCTKAWVTVWRNSGSCRDIIINKLGLCEGLLS